MMHPKLNDAINGNDILHPKLDDAMYDNNKIQFCICTA